MIDHHARHPARPEDAEDFPGGLRGVGGVVDHAPTVDEIKRSVGEGKFLRVRKGQLANQPEGCKTRLHMFKRPFCQVDPME